MRHAQRLDYARLQLMLRFSPSLRRITRIPGCLHRREGAFLHQLASHVPEGGTIVEIGAYLGRSTLYIASALQGRNIRFYSIDTWQHDTPEGHRDIFRDFLYNVAGFWDQVNPIRGDSGQLACDWNCPIDLLWIDGEQSYEACSRIILAWGPFVRDGWICLHGYTKPCGMAQAVTEHLVPICTDPLVVHSIWAARLQGDRLRAGASHLLSSPPPRSNNPPPFEGEREG